MFNFRGSSVIIGDVHIKNRIHNRLLQLSNGVYCSEYFNLEKWKRLLLISGIEYRSVSEEFYMSHIEMRLCNMNDFDRYIRVLSLINDIPIEDFSYNRDKVEWLFCKVNKNKEGLRLYE